MTKDPRESPNRESLGEVKRLESGIAHGRVARRRIRNGLLWPLTFLVARPQPRDPGAMQVNERRNVTVRGTPYEAGL